MGAQGEPLTSCEAPLVVAEAARKISKYRNAVMKLSAFFMLLFAGYNAAQGLQSSLNGTLGYINLGVLYATFSFLCIVAPALLQGFEARGHSMLPLLVLSGLVYCSVIGINAHPIPAEGEAGRNLFVGLSIFLNFMVGVVAPILWTIQNMYVARCAQCAASCSSDPDAMSRTTANFNGTFFMFFQFAGALGTGISTLVLALDKSGHSRTSLFVVLTALAVAGSLGFLCIPQMPTNSEVAALAGEVEGAQRPARCDQTLRLCFTDAKMGLFVPLIFANGCFLSFQFGDYPKNFMTQTLGPDFTGPGLLMFYVTNSVASIMWGSLVHRKVLRIWTVFALAFTAQVVVLAVLMLSVSSVLPLFKQHYKFFPDGKADVHTQWKLTKLGEPAGWEFVAPFACAALSAVGDSAYEMFPAAVLQSFFTDDRMVPAMANLKMWQSLGFMSYFIVSAAVTDTQTRLVVLTAIIVLSFGALGYLNKKVAPVSGGSAAVA